MKIDRCLSCGKIIDEDNSFYHKRCAKKLFGSQQIPALNYTLEELNELAKNTILERVSVPGVQPKLSLHLERGAKETASRLTLVGLAGNYILKPQSPQWKNLPEAEHFCMLLARKCKIIVADFGLIPLKSGELAYITSRMDRQKKRMFHMEDFCQILNKMTSQKYSGSMEQIGKALLEYSTVPGLDAIRHFELAIFCFLTGNSDMHLKNFSMLQKESGKWELSPAYDLVPVKIILPQDTEELALTLNGKKNRLKRSDFETFGASLKLNEVQIRKTIQRITDLLQKFLPETLKESFLPEEMQMAVNTLITERLARINSENGFFPHP